MRILYAATSARCLSSLYCAPLRRVCVHVLCRILQIVKGRYHIPSQPLLLRAEQAQSL